MKKLSIRGAFFLAIFCAAVAGNTVTVYAASKTLSVTHKNGDGTPFLVKFMPLFYLVCPIGAMIYCAVQLKQTQRVVIVPEPQLYTLEEIQEFQNEGGVERMLQELGISQEYHQAVDQ